MIRPLDSQHDDLIDKKSSAGVTLELDNPVKNCILLAQVSIGWQIASCLR